MNVTLIDHMGSDDSVVNAARCSFSKTADQYTEEQNRSLIFFLARGIRNQEHKELVDSLSLGLGDKAEETLFKLKNTATHFVPFCHTALTFRVSAPTNIRVQCFKHKIGLVESEESRRYISTTPEIYVPDHFRMAAKDIKQGSIGIHPDSSEYRLKYIACTQEAVKLYEEMIEDGVAPEQARFVLPQGAIVNWIWTGNLYAFANFYNKRTDPHAQQETQELAAKFGELIKPLFPLSWLALTGDK